MSAYDPQVDTGDTDDLATRWTRAQAVVDAEKAAKQAAVADLVHIRNPRPPTWFTAATVVVTLATVASIGAAATHTGSRTAAIILTATTITLATHWISIWCRRTDQAVADRIAERRHQELLAAVGDRAAADFVAGADRAINGRNRSVVRLNPGARA